MIHQRILASVFAPHRRFFIPLRWKSTSRRRKILNEKSWTLRAMAQFDDLYGSIFQEQWPSIRIALLSPEKKGVVVNNFSDKNKTSLKLQSIGAFNVRLIFEEKKNDLKCKPEDLVVESFTNVYQIDGRIEEALLRQQRADLEQIYPDALSPEVEKSIVKNLGDQLQENQKDHLNDDELGLTKALSADPTKDISLAESLKTADYDKSRLILPGASGVNLSASLYDFIPATKLRGMEDYIPESTHFSYFKDDSEIPINVEFEDEVEFPELLDVYAFERGNCDTFDYSLRGPTNVLDYHILDLGLLAPVLALGLKPGDHVLDLTSSLLDVTMLISQTLIPAMFVANCENQKQATYLLRTLRSYMFDVEEESCNTVVTDSHPLVIEDVNKYDKVFVCVPSTQDRRAMNMEEDNIFHPSSVKNRIRLPEVQASLLRKALQLVKEGGSVVYCTESLSPIQNDSVVQKTLEELWQDSNLKFGVRDLSGGLEPLQCFMKITKSGKYGHLVIPFLPNNCGPLYFCKIVKAFPDVSEE